MYVKTALKNKARRPDPTWGYVSHSETCLSRAQTSSSLFSALFTERTLPHMSSPSPILACSAFCAAPPGPLGFLRFSVRHFSVSLTSLLRPSFLKTFFLLLPKICLSLTSPAFHHGGIRTVPDLRHNLRDHKPVRPPPETSMWDLARSDC